MSRPFPPALSALPALLLLSNALAAQAQGSLSSSKAYVGLFKDNAVAVVDTAAGKVLGTIPVPAGPPGGGGREKLTWWFIPKPRALHEAIWLGP